MSKTGWRDVTERYYAATGLVHDNEQFGNRLRQLKGVWGFIQKLRKSTGLGRRADGSVLASDEWWKENTMVQYIPSSFVLHYLSTLFYHYDLFSCFIFLVVCRIILNGGGLRMGGLLTWMNWTACSWV
jgi:hypothetical protein